MINNKFIITFLICFCTVFFTQGQVDNYAVHLTNPTGGSEGGSLDVDTDVFYDTNKFTVQFWLKVDEWSGKQTNIIHTQSDSNDAVVIQFDNTSKFIWFKVNVKSDTSIQFSNPVKLKTWTHLTFVYDGAQSELKNQIKLYADGVLIPINSGDSAAKLPTKTTNNAGAKKLHFGSGPLGKDYNFKDVIVDDLAFLKGVALAKDEIVFDNTLETAYASFGDKLTYYKFDNNFKKDKTSVEYDYISDKEMTLTYANNIKRVKVTDNAKLKYSIITAYVRHKFFLLGGIDDQTIAHNNDVILLGAGASTSGDLLFGYPDNNGISTPGTVIQVKNFGGRTNGQAHFKGDKASLNVGTGLLLDSYGKGVNSFAFGTWVNLDNFTNSVLFAKGTCRLGVNIFFEEVSGVKTLKVTIANGSESYVAIENPKITIGKWTHIAVIYKGTESDKVSIYIDGTKQAITKKKGTLPTKIPDALLGVSAEIGTKLEGKLDATYLANKVLPNMHIWMKNGLPSNAWELSHFAAIWNYEDATNLGKDDHSYGTSIASIRKIFKGKQGMNIRLGLAGNNFSGNIAPFTSMMGTAEKRAKFATQVADYVKTHKLDGVDFDFEWCYSDINCWNNYSKTVKAIRTKLPRPTNAGDPKNILTVSLHPVSYEYPKSGFSDVDYFALQSYGPNSTLWSLTKYKSDIIKLLNYGVPREKLQGGLPFFATDKNNSGGSEISYAEIIKQHPSIDPTLDEITATYRGKSYTYTFNGVNTIAKKVKYTKAQNLAGIMYWDTATDVKDYKSKYSLLRELNSHMSANVQTYKDDTSLMVTSTLIHKAPEKSCVSFDVNGDDDSDTILNGVDNCPNVANKNQLDTDGDNIGDACDDDDDNDTILDEDDNCPMDVNTDQNDPDKDGKGEVCDDFEEPLIATQGFSPNGDGINDTWVLNLRYNTEYNSVKIYDKAGRLLYTKAPYDNSWDGTFNGKKLASGSYLYIIHYKRKDGIKKTVKGWLYIHN